MILKRVDRSFASRSDNRAFDQQENIRLQRLPSKLPSSVTVSSVDQVLKVKNNEITRKIANKKREEFNINGLNSIALIDEPYYGWLNHFGVIKL